MAPVTPISRRGRRAERRRVRHREAPERRDPHVRRRRRRRRDRALPAQRQRPHRRRPRRRSRRGSTLTSTVPDTPGYSSFGFCDGQCSYDSYVYVPPGARRRHRLPLRRESVQREQLRSRRARPFERSRRAALDQRRRPLHGHDRRHVGSALSVRAAPGPPRARHQPAELEAVLRRRRRRHRPLERQLRRRLGRLHEPEVLRRGPARVLPARALARAGEARVHEQGPADAALLPDRGQPS